MNCKLNSSHKLRKKLPKKSHQMADPINFLITNGFAERLNWMQSLEKMRKAKSFVDGVIRTSDDKAIEIDRIVMAASSGYFKALYANTFGNDHIRDVHFPDINSEIMEIIVHFAYIGQLKRVTMDNIQSLIQAADRLQVNGILDHCHQFLIGSLNINNCIRIFQLSRMYYAPEVIEKSKLFILHNFQTIVGCTNDYLLLNHDELSDILSDDRLNVGREEVPYSALSLWLSWDQHRTQHFSKLLKMIRLGNADIEFVSTTIMNNALIANDESMRDYISMAESVLRDINNYPSPSKFNPRIHPFLRPRIPKDIIFAYGGWSMSNAINIMETYDCRVNKWYSMNGIDEFSRIDSPYRAYHGMVYLKGLIYIIGGFNGNTYFNTVRVFDPRTRLWCDCSCMHIARCYVSVAVCNEKIYAMGGYDGTVRTSSAEVYDCQKNQWNFIKEMHETRSDASAASLDGKVYIVGGFNGNDVLNSAEVYDPETNVWSLINNMNNPRSGVQLVAYESSLYVIAGNDGQTRQTSIEHYDPITNEWTLMADMQIPRSNFACVVLEGLIYVIGGFNGMTTICEVESYDPNTNSWHEMWRMGVNRSALSACVVSELDNGKEYSWLRRELLHSKSYSFTKLRSHSLDRTFG